MNIMIAISAIVAAPMASAADGAKTRVNDQGPTRIVSRPSGAPMISATITTRRATAAEMVGNRATRCSGGRQDCSLVDHLTLEVAGKAVDVSPRAVLLLADVDDAQLRTLGGGRYQLVLTCGDAAPAYQARLSFDRHRVDRLDIWSDEAGMIEQSTIFHDVSKAFR